MTLTSSGMLALRVNLPRRRRTALGRIISQAKNVAGVSVPWRKTHGRSLAGQSKGHVMLVSWSFWASEKWKGGETACRMMLAAQRRSEAWRGRRSRRPPCQYSFSSSSGRSGSSLSSSPSPSSSSLASFSASRAISAFSRSKSAANSALMRFSSWMRSKVSGS